jgi:DNA excision repair protein ERCC-8
MLTLQLCVETEIRSSHLQQGATCLDCESIEERYLLCGGADGRVSLFDMEKRSAANSRADRIRCADIISTSMISSNATGALQRISCVQWYPTDTGLFVTGGLDGLVRIWDTNAFKVALEFSVDDRVYGARMNNNLSSTSSSSSPLIAVASEGHIIRLCDPICGSAAIPLSGHKSGVACLDWCPGSEYMLASGGLDGSVKIWDIRNGGSRSQLVSFDWRQENIGLASRTGKAGKKLLIADNLRAHEGAVMSMKYSSCGSFLVTAGNDRFVRLWSAASDAKSVGIVKKQIPAGCFSRLPYQILIAELSGSSNADILAVPDDSGLVTFFDLHKSSDVDPRHMLKGHIQQVTGITWRQYNQEVITSAKDGLILLWRPMASSSGGDDENGMDEREALLGIGHDDWSDEEGNDTTGRNI